MRKLGLLISYLFITLLIFFLASDFSLGYSIYCGMHGYRYAQLGFDCSNHVNSFLSAFLRNPQTYFFTFSILLVILLFFRHIPYLKSEYWVRVADKPVWWVGKKVLLLSLEVMAVFYPLFVVSGLVLGFSVAWEVQLLFYPLYLFIFTAMVTTFFHVVYVTTEKYVIALFAFFFTNNIYIAIIDEIAWLMPTTSDLAHVGGLSWFAAAKSPFIINLSIFYIILMLAASSIILVIALKRKECYR